MNKSLLTLFALAASVVPTFAHSVYVTPTSDGFESRIMAALKKKHVPVLIVTNPEEAEYILTPSGLQIHKESTGSKVTRCIFAYCAGIQDSGDVAVQLVHSRSHEVVWAYQVAKQNGAWNRQSMAEAIAKHLKKDVFRKNNQ